MLPPIWFIYRYRKKHGYRRVPKGNILDRGLDLEKHEEDLSLSEYGTAKTEMHRDEAINILSEIRAGFSGEILHYVDVMSSMPISKSTLCHSLEPDAGIIRRDTCIDGTKSDCWGCGVQVCEVSPARSNSSHHHHPHFFAIKSRNAKSLDASRPLTQHDTLRAASHTVAHAIILCTAALQTPVSGVDNSPTSMRHIGTAPHSAFVGSHPRLETML